MNATPSSSSSDVSGELHQWLEEMVDRKIAEYDRKSEREGVTLLAFSGDMEQAIATLFLANSAATLGKPTTIFFAFWGISAIRRSKRYRGKSIKQMLMTMMSPGNIASLGTSKKHMGGMGPIFFKAMMKDKQVDDLATQLATAQRMGVRLIACSTSVELMGITPEELIDGVEFGGITTFLGAATRSSTSLAL